MDDDIIIGSIKFIELLCLHGWTWSRQVGRWVEELVMADRARAEEASMAARARMGR
jgi:hypothetical protein